MKRIPLSQGKFAIVDDNDFERVSRYKWSVRVREDRKGRCIAMRRVGRIDGKQVFETMHRFIMEAKPGQQVDHANGNSLDNRKENLRFCTPTENMANRRKYRGISRYKGVTFEARTNRTKKWSARIGECYLGSFESEEDAAIVYNVAAQLLYGEFAVLNDV